MTKLERAPTRTYHNPIMESARWDDHAIRPDDIVIATYPKCGTTWTQRIIDLLVFQDPAPRPIMDVSVWLDARIFGTQEENLATLDAQTHRRFIKSHLPLDSLPIYDTVCTSTWPATAATPSSRGTTTFRASPPIPR